MKSVGFVIISLGKSIYLETMIQKIVNYYPIILVDNTTNGFLKPLSEKYNVTYVHETIKGASVSRNTGSKLAGNFDYIFFLDDDLEFTNGWKEALETILQSDCDYNCIGGKVIAEYDKQINIPSKYLYLVGEKNLGTDEKIVTNDYLGSCNLLVRSKLFFDIGKFDLNFGHKNGCVGLNEDVLFQEQVRRKGFNIHYFPQLKFIHHWSGTEKMLLERVRIQGIYDRILDLKINKTRYFLRIIKYILFLLYYHFVFEKENNIAYKYDFLRYYAYVFGYKSME